MAGAEFIRVDLHVHTFPDAGQAQLAAAVPVAEYIRVATERGIRVLGITDHNTAENVAEAVEAARGTSLLVLPGIEISTHEGHLLGLFAPSAISDLEAFAHPTNLQLMDVGGSDEKRSRRSMLDLVSEIADCGALAIPAHVDADDGMTARMASTAVAELLQHPGLAALEFATREGLETWFTDGDTDNVRRNAWLERQRVDVLRERGLARVMTSDAHSIEKVGEDRSKRTLTRLRLDEPNFDAVRNAIVFNPKARCKAEAILPFSYPRVLGATFVGGFLDGVTIDFSENLNCIIGGRGSGKSTALLAVVRALGAPIPRGEDPDKQNRMPDVTEVKFVDSAGSERIARRERHGKPLEPSTGAPVQLQVADLGQDESGQLARGYSDEPGLLLEFLDGFVDLRAGEQTETDLMQELDENAAEVLRSNVDLDELRAAEQEQKRLQGSLKAAEKGQVEELARWASLLARQTPFLGRIEAEIAALTAPGSAPNPVDLDALAIEYEVDLTIKPATDFVEGANGLRAQLAKLRTENQMLRDGAKTSLEEASAPAKKALHAWKSNQVELQSRRDERQAQLEAQGLKVQAGAIRELADQLNAADIRLRELRTRKRDLETAQRARAQLLNRLHSNRDAIYERRRATLKMIVQSANAVSDDLRLHLYYDRAGMRDPWIQWLSSRFGFHRPRVERLADKITPAELAETILRQPADLLALKDNDATPFFTQAQIDEALPKVRTWHSLFELQTMRLKDRPRIDVEELGSATRRAFDHLSAGQQRSVLLSLLLCAPRDEPLILDQPEDHLDALYIAKSVVRHLEAAKERRQVILATHSANLTVLGDAELVIPMYAEHQHGEPQDPGAVDRIETRKHVCSLLEGGEEAFAKRAERYGFKIEPAS